MNDALLLAALRAQKAGDAAEAARLCTDLLRADPKHFGALYLLGLVRCDAGRFEEGQHLLADALAANPRSAEASYMRGCALRALNRLPEALLCFERAVAIRPDFIEAHVNRAAALVTLKRGEEALEAIGKALALDSGNAGAWNNRGCILQELGRAREAVAAFEKASALRPDFTAALTNLASALADLTRYRDAAAVSERALALTPDLPYMRGNLALYRLHACDWRHYDADRADIAAGLKAGKRVVTPFVNLLLSRSMDDQLACARIYVANDAPASDAPLWRGERYGHDRIRLAYVSADFRAHAVAALTAGVFEHHDRTRFEAIGVSCGRNDHSPMRARIAAAFEHFLDGETTSAEEIAARLRAMEVDIAVDLTGYTQHHRPGLFGLRPAPIQVNYLGYPGTLGAGYIDYILADKTIIPEVDRRRCAEAVVYLPDSYQCNDAKHPSPARTPARDEAGLPESGFVFCCFNNSYKIAPETFAIWMRLLRDVDGSVLWLLEDSSEAAANLRREAEARSVAPERLVFAPRISHAEHLARHRCAGLFLDTLPYGAHTSAGDALWEGLPVVTCRGSTFAGRVAASLLEAVRMPELIAESLEAYETLAVALARDPARFAGLKAKLVRNRETAPLFDTARITRNLEAAYETMWRRWQDGLAPEGFAVDDAEREQAG
jgi:protein O-GlcNAc transferase